MNQPSDDTQVLFDNLQRQYCHACADYLAHPDESSLQAAHHLGQEALGNGLEFSHMARMHHESMRQILSHAVAAEVALPGEPGSSGDRLRLLRALFRSLSPDESSAAVTAAGYFLAESAVPFERTYRQTRDAAAALNRRQQRLEERSRRIAHTLYDETLQLLAATHLALHQATASTPAAAHESLSHARVLLEQIEAQLQAVSHDLRPVELDHLGLGAALQSLAQSFSSRTGLQVTVEAGARRISPTLATLLFRAVEEILSSIVLHSRAQQVRIRLHSKYGTVTCSVSDDDDAFAAAEVPETGGERGLSLIGIRECLRSFSGTLSVRPLPGKGTEVSMMIPQLLSADPPAAPRIGFTDYSPRPISNNPGG